MSAHKVMEAALRNDVAECEKRVTAATPRPVVSKGKLTHKGTPLSLEVAERDLVVAQRRLENWLSEREL